MLIFTLTVFSRSSVIGGGDVIEKFPKLCNLYQRVTISSFLSVYIHVILSMVY